MADVWISYETISYYEGSEVLGVSSTKEKAKQVCEARESEKGENACTPLNWDEDWPDQAHGYVRKYIVRKYEVDKETT